MRSKTVLRLAGFVSAVLAGMLAALWVTVGVRAQETARPLAPGPTASGEVRDRFGDVWSVYLCEGDSVTVTARSAAFTPVVEWYAPGSETPASEAEGEGGTALLATGPLETGGSYRAAIGGLQRSDRGAYTLAVALAATEGLDMPDGWLAPGGTVTGSVRTRFGDIWQLHACAGDALTVTMTSTAFVPYLELMPAGGEIASASATGAGGVAQLAADAAVETSDFWVTASGLERTDRGAYALTVIVSGAVTPTSAGAAPTATHTPTRTPTRAATRTPTPTATPTPAQASCTVLVNQLNLRSGPGTIFDRLAQLASGATLRPLGRDAASNWIKVTVDAGGRQGWVLADPDYVTCTVALDRLPVTAAPPTPTPTRTPTPTATPTLPALVILPAPSNGDMPGELYTGVGMASSIDSDTGITTFRDRFYLRLEPGETDRPVDAVVFTVYDLDTGRSEPVHVQREEEYGYCLFGGGTPECNALELGPGARWPSTGEIVYNGSYNVIVDVYLSGDAEGSPTGQWFGSIALDSPRLPNHTDTSSTEPLPLEVELYETAPGTTQTTLNGQISFGVSAWDPNVGTTDGAGIREVFLRIYDAAGNLVHERREGTERWCAFMGGEPECNVYDYAAAGYVWPNGMPVTPGPHTLSATVVGDDGRTTTREWSVSLQ